MRQDEAAIVRGIDHLTHSVKRIWHVVASLPVIWKRRPMMITSCKPGDFYNNPQRCHQSFNQMRNFCCIKCLSLLEITITSQDNLISLPRFYNTFLWENFAQHICKKKKKKYESIELHIVGLLICYVKLINVLVSCVQINAEAKGKR